jgi:hypothetical protein
MDNRYDFRAFAAFCRCQSTGVVERECVQWALAALARVTSFRGFASLNVTEASAVQKADQPRNLDLDFFSN